MEFQITNVRFLGAEEESLKMKDGEHVMLKAHFFVRGETFDIFVIDTHANYVQVCDLNFGDEVTLNCQLVKRDTGGYKVKLLGLV